MKVESTGQGAGVRRLSATRAGRERYQRIGLSGFVGVFAYGSMLVAAEVLIVVPWFGYVGFSAVRPDVAKFLVFLGSYTLAGSQLPARLVRPSQLMYWLLFLLVVAPVHVVNLLIDQRGRPSPLPMVLAVSVMFVGLSLIYRIRLSKLPIAPNAGRGFWLVAGILMTFVVVAIIVDFGFTLSVPSFDRVYSVRSEYRDLVKGASVFGSYAVYWTSGLLAPMYVFVGIVHRKLPVLLIGLGVEVLVFSLTGFKSVIFSSLLLVALLSIARQDVGKMASEYLVWSAAIGGGLIVAVECMSGTFYVTSLMLRRFVLVAGLNTYNYYEYFNTRPKYHYAQSLLIGSGSSPYSLDPPHLIGSVFHGNAAMSANANLWADGFANLGFGGMLLATIVIGGFMFVYDSVAKHRDLRVAALLLAMPSVSLSNSALFTSLLTHGLLLALVILVFAPTSDLSFGVPCAARRRPIGASGPATASTGSDNAIDPECGRARAGAPGR